MLKTHPRILLNGEIRLGSDALTPVLSPGFLYGIGAFETARWRVGRGVFKLHAHARRMARALRYLHMPADAAEADAMRRAAETTAEANRLNEDAAVRWTTALGAGGELINIVHMRPLSYSKEEAEAGVSAVTFSVERGDCARYKTLNYAPNLLAKQAAQRAGCAEAVLINRDGAVLEASTANLFIVQNGALATPPLDLPILPGVTRGAVLEAARKCGIAAHEKTFTALELAQAEEAFLTNAAGGIVPLVQLNGKAVGGGKGAGRAARTLQKALAQMVERELGA